MCGFVLLLEVFRVRFARVSCPRLRFEAVTFIRKLTNNRIKARRARRRPHTRTRARHVRILRERDGQRAMRAVRSVRDDEDADTGCTQAAHAVCRKKDCCKKATEASSH